MLLMWLKCPGGGEGLGRNRSICREFASGEARSEAILWLVEEAELNELAKK